MSAQLSLLNVTVQQISTFISRKLTLIYQHIYGVADKQSNYTIEISSYPLTSIDDIISIHNTKLISYKTLIPLTLSSLGESTTTIENEVNTYEDNLKTIEKENNAVKESPPSSAPDNESIHNNDNKEES